jgi:hypothetical protein
LSSEDGVFLPVEKSFAKCLKFSASVEDFFRQSLASDDGESVDDYFFQGLSANETSSDTDASEEEDIHALLDNGSDEELRSCRQRRVASRKLRQLNQHPSAPPGGANLPGEPIDMRPFRPNPTCPRNGRRLHAAQIWQAQATSIQSASFITSDALIGTLATPHVESTASHLDVRAWVNNALSYLKQQDGVVLGVGSVETMIARCQLVSVHATGSSFIAMITYMQLAMQCQRYLRTSLGFLVLINNLHDSIIMACEEPSNIRKFYNDKVAKLGSAPSERTFHRWYEHGCKFILLAAGGSFYLLVIIAGLEIRWKVASMRFSVLQQVGSMLRQPGIGGE